MTAGRRLRNPLRRMAVVMTAFLVIVIYGTVGYAVIEHNSVIDALFMTVTTITTVGLEAHPLDAAGEIFTITLIVLGVATFLYLFELIVEVLSGNRWQAYRRYRRMEAQIAALRDHIIVCGYGRTGKRVTVELRHRRVPYVVIEMNPTPLEDVVREHEPHIVGDAANDDVLHLAGVDRARALVSAVDSDERNVYIVLTARSLNPGLFIVARSSYPELGTEAAARGRRSGREPLYRQRLAHGGTCRSAGGGGCARLREHAGHADVHRGACRAAGRR